MLSLIQDPSISTAAMLQTIAAMLLVLGAGMTVHEFAHCLIADRMGDDTPRRMGRLTLNPLVHINWVGWLMFALIGFGILGSAPINARRMHNPRWGFLAAVAAGPLANLALALFFALVAGFLGAANLYALPQIARAVILMMVYWNLLLAVFNLLPLYPLDGWQIVLAALPPASAYEWQRHAQTSQYVFFGLIILSFMLPNFNLLGALIGEPVDWLARNLLGRENYLLFFFTLSGR
ncbi:MAG: site-2 protease family protein [Chloroflexi bacterium]|nr:site-2 protease family protein [Chloroflexota bacterium]